MQVTLQDKLWAAGIEGRRADWSFETFPADAQNGKAKKAVYQWVEQSPTPGLVLHGIAGTGKTGLAIAVARHAIENGLGDTMQWFIKAGPGIQEAVTKGQWTRRPAPVWMERWLQMHDRLQNIIATDRDDEYSFRQALIDLERVELLILDDIDTGTLTPWKEEVLLRMVERPEHSRPLIVIANRHPLSLVDHIGERIADRLTDAQLFTNISVQGTSLRQR